MNGDWTLELHNPSLLCAALACARPVAQAVEAACMMWRPFKLHFPGHNRSSACLALTGSDWQLGFAAWETTFGAGTSTDQ